ncbi:hypothetical protein GCM10008110_17160 [Marinobacter persicus]|nr:hypothetical protein GCM10008110_17160 [Marinobacter persicus]
MAELYAGTRLAFRRRIIRGAGFQTQNAFGRPGASRDKARSHALCGQRQSGLCLVINATETGHFPPLSRNAQGCTSGHKTDKQGANLFSHHMAPDWILIDPAMLTMN